MENKLIVDEFNILDFELHENYKSVRIIDEKANFPISWLNTQGYCEYSLYLERSIPGFSAQRRSGCRSLCSGHG